MADDLVDRLKQYDDFLTREINERRENSGKDSMVNTLLMESEIRTLETIQYKFYQIFSEAYKR